MELSSLCLGVKTDLVATFSNCCDGMEWLDNNRYYYQGCIQKMFPGGGKLGPHKRMTLAIMIIAYIYTSICLLRFALFA